MKPFLIAARSIRPVFRLVVGLGSGCVLSGCTVLTVAGAVTGAAVSVTASVVSTSVEVTGKVVGATVDAVSSSDK